MLPSLAHAAGPLLSLSPELFLRPLRVEDVSDAYVEGINDPRVSRFLISVHTQQQDRSSVCSMVERNWAADDAILFGIFSAGQHVGNVRLHDITSLTAYMGIAIFRAECHGKGIGCAAISAVARYALENLGIKRVLAGVNKQNLASLRAFNRVGFRFLAADDDGEGMLLCLP